MFGFIEKIVIGLFSTCTIGSLDEPLSSNLKRLMKCVLLNNQPCKARPIIVNINSDKTHFYIFIDSVNKCDGRFVFQIKLNILL